SPLAAQDRLLDVRAFGATHGLDLLTTAEWPAERAEGLEMLAVAGRVPDADGVFVESVSDLTLFLVLHRFRAQSVVPWLISRPTPRRITHHGHIRARCRSARGAREKRLDHPAQRRCRATTAAAAARTL